MDQTIHVNVLFIMIILLVPRVLLILTILRCFLDILSAYHSTDINLKIVLRQKKENKISDS